MSDKFPADLASIQAEAGASVDLGCLQDDIICQAMEQLCTSQADQNSKLNAMNTMLQRRLAMFSPQKGFSNEVYHASTSSGMSLM